jgi:hypothetical protein
MVPGAKLAVQLEPQSMPAGADVRVSVPAPENATDSAYRLANTADAASAALITRLHVEALPLQLPLQPLNALPLIGVAVSKTALRAGKVAVHVPGQLIPAGVDVTLPFPTTLTETGLRKSAETAV